MLQRARLLMYRDSLHGPKFRLCGASEKSGRNVKWGSNGEIRRPRLMHSTAATLACVHLHATTALQPAHLMPLLGATGCKIYRTEGRLTAVLSPLRGLLSTQVGQSVHPPDQQGQAQV
jgi:hypothetical protein